MEIRKTFKIPVGNLSSKDVHKLINKIIDQYKNSDYSIIKEIERKELLKIV